MRPIVERLIDLLLAIVTFIYTHLIIPLLSEPASTAEQSPNIHLTFVPDEEAELVVTRTPDSSMQQQQGDVWLSFQL